MCDPVTLAVTATAISATQGVVSYMGAQQQAKDINAAYKENAANSIIAYQEDIEANNLDYMSRQEDVALSTMQNQRQGLEARAAATVDSGGRGVGGLTASAIQRAVGFQAGENAAYIERNAQLNAQRARLTQRATTSTAQSRINSAQSSRGPSLLALGANLAGSAVSGFSMYSGLKADQATTQAAINRGI